LTLAVPAANPPIDRIDTRRWAPLPLIALVVAAIASVLAARLGALWVIDPGTAQPFWLATGVTIGIALASPIRLRPLVVLGGVVGQPQTRPSPSHPVAGDILATAVEVGIGVAVLGRWFGRSDRMGRSSWTIAAFGLCFVVSAAGALSPLPGSTRSARHLRRPLDHG